jgi:hypothetical protein
VAGSEGKCRFVMVLIKLAVTVGLIVSVLAPTAASAMARSRIYQAGRLSGTWHVMRTCTAGCTGRSSMTELVRPLRTGVFTASGTASMVLYKLGPERVLVHSSTSSSLLTVRVPGQQMTGRGVDLSGDTFRTTWTCIAALHTTGHAVRDVVSGARAIC